MQRRIGSLEDENRQLRSEASQLADDTAECENAEQRLVADIALRLGEAILWLCCNFVTLYLNTMLVA